MYTKWVVAQKIRTIFPSIAESSCHTNAPLMLVELKSYCKLFNWYNRIYCGSYYKGTFTKNKLKDPYTIKGAKIPVFHMSRPSYRGPLFLTKMPFEVVTIILQLRYVT